MELPRGSKKIEDANAMPEINQTLTNVSDSKGEVEDMDTNRGIDMNAVPSGVSEVYQKKVAIMNQALVDIGMGNFQWKIFALTGFGWFVDNVSKHQH